MGLGMRRRWRRRYRAKEAALAAVTAAATRTASLAAAARNAGSGISATLCASLSLSRPLCGFVFLRILFFLFFGEEGKIDGWIGVAGTNGTLRWRLGGRTRGERTWGSAGPTWEF